MISRRTVLQNMLSEDLNSRFLKEFSRRMPVIYQESISRSAKDEAIDEALKPYYFGQTRYTLVQSLFLSVGRECDHKAGIVHCDTNGFPIPVVSIGRFNFTVHHAYDANDISVLNSSLIRKQHSQINEDYVQPNLFGCTFNEQKLLSAQNVYANIIFGCRVDGMDFASYGFLRIAVPYLKKVKGKDKLFYAENNDYFGILQMVLEKEKVAQEQKPTVNIATPKLKKIEN